jgi:hypothetical protein
MEAANVLRVDPELKEDGNLIGDENDYWMEPDENYWKKKNNFEILNPAKSERYCKIIVFTGVVNNMCGPEDSQVVRNSVSPIATEIENNIARDKCPPLKFHPPGYLIIYGHKNIEQKCFYHNTN